MQRRRSFAGLEFILMFFCLSLQATSLSAAAGPPEKALWVVRNSLLSRQSIDNLVNRTARAGFNTLFVQVCGRGDSYFPSRVYPPAESYAGIAQANFDPLAYLLEKAHARGLKVHAWVNTLLVWSSPKAPISSSHVLNSRPEWMMVDSRGVSLSTYSRAKFNGLNLTGVFISVAGPEARRLIERFVLDLASRYPIDGIHFDYLRYPMRSVDFSPRLRSEFLKAYGVDPLELFAVSRKQGGRSDAETARLKKQWTAFRAEVITRFLRGVCRSLNMKKPDLVRSAAVKPDIDSAYRVFGQDWPRWVKEGLLDMVLPMAYSTNNQTVYDQISRASRAVGGERVWAGLRAYDVQVSGIVEKVVRLRRLGLKGFCFFSYNGVEDNPLFFERIPKALLR